METTKKNEDCRCTSQCVRHGDCEACRKHHENAGTKTACQRGNPG